MLKMQGDYFNFFSLYTLFKSFICQNNSFYLITFGVKVVILLNFQYAVARKDQRFNSYNINVCIGCKSIMKVKFLCIKWEMIMVKSETKRCRLENQMAAPWIRTCNLHVCHQCACVSTGYENGIILHTH